MKALPNADNIKFKEKFVERYTKLTDWENYKQHSLSFLSRAIRINTLKGSIIEIKKSIENKGWKLKQIPWCKEGFWIEHPERRDVGNLLEHQLGKIYVQEAASMIPPLALEPKSGELVMDMCAAPGSKTTQMASMMKNQGLLIANDVSGERLQSLGINLQRCGTTNTLITLGTGYRFKKGNFDRILVDAPCSATGTLMRSLKIIQMWNPKMVKNLSRIQGKLLQTAFDNLKQKGNLVYSTCTLEPEEDEGVISKFLNENKNSVLEKINLPGLNSSPPVLEFGKEKYHPEVKKCLRIWPQDNYTEGFFIAKIKKI